MCLLSLLLCLNVLKFGEIGQVEYIFVRLDMGLKKFPCVYFGV